MLPGILVAAGASDNSFELGERYDAAKDARQKQERVRGAAPIMATTVLAGALILLTSIAFRYLLLPLLEIGE